MSRHLLGVRAVYVERPIQCHPSADQIETHASSVIESELARSAAYRPWLMLTLHLHPLHLVSIGIETNVFISSWPFSRFESPKHWAMCGFSRSFCPYRSIKDTDISDTNCYVFSRINSKSLIPHSSIRPLTDLNILVATSEVHVLFWLRPPRQYMPVKLCATDLP